MFQLKDEVEKKTTIEKTIITGQREGTDSGEEKQARYGKYDGSLLLTILSPVHCQARSLPTHLSFSLNYVF